MRLPVCRLLGLISFHSCSTIFLMPHKWNGKAYHCVLHVLSCSTRPVWVHVERHQAGCGTECHFSLYASDKVNLCEEIKDCVTICFWAVFVYSHIQARIYHMGNLGSCPGALEPIGALCDWVFFFLSSWLNLNASHGGWLQPLNTALDAPAHLHLLSNQNKIKFVYNKRGLMIVCSTCHFDDFTGSDWQPITMHCWLAKNKSGRDRST